MNKYNLEALFECLVNPNKRLTVSDVIEIYNAKYRIAPSAQHVRSLLYALVDEGKLEMHDYWYGERVPKLEKPREYFIEGKMRLWHPAMTFSLMRPN